MSTISSSSSAQFIVVDRVHSITEPTMETQAPAFPDTIFSVDDEVDNMLTKLLDESSADGWKHTCFAYEEASPSKPMSDKTSVVLIVAPQQTKRCSLEKNRLVKYNSIYDPIKKPRSSYFRK